MAAAYKTLGKRINDFLGTKDYDLNRTAKINVFSDKVNWSLENKLDKAGALQSELDVSHSFDRDTLSFKTSTVKAPKFELKTKRFASKFDVKASINDPKLEINLTQKRDKYQVVLDSTYDWSSHDCDAVLALSYAVNNTTLVGFKGKVLRGQDSPVSVSDYNVGVQWNRNADQTFAVTTEDQLQRVKVGAEFKVRDDYKGFAQVSYNTKPDSTALGYSVGVQRKICGTSSVSGVFRNNQTASVLYSNNFPDSKICGKVAANFDFNKDIGKRMNLQWKIVFGAGGSGGCCKK